MNKQHWLDAMGIPPEFAYTYEYEDCPDLDNPCACESCRSEAQSLAE